MIRIAAMMGWLLLASSSQAAEAAAAMPIEALDHGLLQVMHAGKATPFGQRYATLTPIVQHTFDLQTILETSIGSRWRTFTPEQQGDLQAEFLRFTVASYVSNFSSFSGEKFEIDPETRALGADQVVASHIVPASGDPARIDYQMRQGNGGWRVVDVLLDGSISRVAVQRSDFRGLLDNGGPAALLTSLRKKVTDLAGGAAVP